MRRTDSAKDMMKEKLATVRHRGYFEGHCAILCLMHFFWVPKGADDIRMVYNGTSSGLNPCLWAPNFVLPTVETHLRGVEPGYWMADRDLGEMFLNFVLHESLRQYCGVDFTHYFPDEIPEGQRKLWETMDKMLHGDLAITVQCHARGGLGGGGCTGRSLGPVQRVSLG